MNFYSGFNMKSLLKLVLFLVFIFSFNSLGQSGRWYLSSAGLGNQDGKSRENARLYTNSSTLNIQPGDTVFFLQGIYNQVFTIPKSGTANHLVFYMPDPQNTGDVIFSGVGNNYTHIEGRNRSYFVFKKFKFRNTSSAIRVGPGKGVYIDSLDIRKCISGMLIRGDMNPSSTNYNFDPKDTNTDSIFIRWNYILLDSIINTQTDGIGIYWAHGVRLIGNYIEMKNNYGDGHNDCIQTSHAIGDLWVTDNVFINHKEESSQIAMLTECWAGYKQIFYNNISIHYGLGVGYFGGMALDGILPSPYSWKDEGRTYFIHNTVIGQRTNLFAGKKDSVYAYNNIFVNKVQSAGYGVWATPTNDIIDEFTSDYNLFYTDLSNAVINRTNFLTWGSGGQQTLSSWQTQTGRDLHSIWADPSFVNLFYNRTMSEQEDVRLQSSSPARGLGTSSIKTLVESLELEWRDMKNPYYNAFGITRPSSGSVDAGAIQFGSIFVNQDLIPPKVINAQILDSITVKVIFSEPLEQSSANNPNNYSIDNGININSVQFSGVVATLNTSVHSPGFYNINVSNVSDTAGNIISTQNNSATYGYNPDPINQLLKFVPGRTNASSIPEPEHRPEKTFDGLGYNSGDPTSRWAGQYLPQWIGYDLNDVRMLSKVRIQFYNWQNGRIYNYSIQVSTDSINWVSVKSNVLSQLAEWTEETFEPTPARYIRIIVHSNNQNDWASIWEAEFYGQLMVSNNDDQKNIPTVFALNQNYPNPFNPSTTISWQSPVSGWQTLKVYDMLGNEVVTLVDEYREAGSYNLQFTINNLQLTSGVYFYQLRIGDPSTSSGSLSSSGFSTGSGSGQAKQGFVETKKMILLK